MLWSPAGAPLPAFRAPVGAIAIPYFAVVIANSRRPAGATGFQPYRPNLPERYAPPGDNYDQSPSDGGDR